MSEKMLPESAEAIRIADKHLADFPIERRKALALDIQDAIGRYAYVIAMEAIRKGFEGAQNNVLSNING